MDKAKIIQGLENWLEDHQGETLPLAFQSVQELYDVLTSEDENDANIQK
jgi:hypothetical protein